MAHHLAIEPRLAGLDLFDGLDEHLGCLILQQHAQRAAPDSIAVGRRVAKPGKDEHSCLPGGRQQLGERYQEPFSPAMSRSNRMISGCSLAASIDRRLQVAGLADDCNCGSCSISMRSPARTMA